MLKAIPVPRYYEREKENPGGWKRSPE